MPIELFENFESHGTLENIIEEEFGIGPDRLEGVLISTEDYSVSVKGMIFAYLGRTPTYTWTVRLERFKYVDGKIYRMDKSIKKDGGKAEGYIYREVIWLYLSKSTDREMYSTRMQQEFNQLFEDYDVPYKIEWKDINTTDSTEYDILVLLPKE